MIAIIRVMLRAAQLTLAAVLILSGVAEARELRVCADPNNLPFSNNQRQGFENKLAELLANQLHVQLTYVWWPQFRGYARHTLKADKCDLWLGVAAGIERMATTRPYYTSTYVTVTRSDRNLTLASLDDPRLRRLRIGVQMIGDDADNTPPAHALARRGIVDNVHGYMIYGNFKRAMPEREIIDAVDSGKIDVAFVWGPIAGYFASMARTTLTVRPVVPAEDGPWPMTFGIAVGMRRGDKALRDEVQQVLDRRVIEVQQILAAYHVPVVQSPVQDPLPPGQTSLLHKAILTSDLTE